MPQLLVNRGDLRNARVAEPEDEPQIDAGQALLRVEAFGMTSNNVTYAVMGEAMSYWDFFSPPGEWGVLPVWGFAEVERSEVGGVEAGARLYGYLPASSHLVVTPAAAGPRGFVDASPHRRALPSAYHRYLVTEGDIFHTPESEGIQMLLRPLFFTSFLIDDQLADDGLTARGAVLISSASSKTAISAAFLLARREGVEVVGLTSAANVEFVRGLGIYATVLSYDEIASLPREAATLVDIAGDDELRSAVHAHLEEELLYSMAVGVTHWEDFRSLEGEALPGPAPKFFFAPIRVTKRSADWGPAGLERRVADAWRPFCEWTTGWLEEIPGQGLDAALAAYLEVLDGRVPPERAHVLSV